MVVASRLISRVLDRFLDRFLFGDQLNDVVVCLPNWYKTKMVLFKEEKLVNK